MTGLVADLLFLATSDARASAPVRRSVEVRGDSGQVGQVVRNLPDNAVRYASSRVVVELTADSTRAVLVVADDGPGIPPRTSSGSSSGSRGLMTHEVEGPVDLVWAWPSLARSSTATAGASSPSGVLTALDSPWFCPAAVTFDESPFRFVASSKAGSVLPKRTLAGRAPTCPEPRRGYASRVEPTPTPTSLVRGRSIPTNSGRALRFVGLGDSLTQGVGDPRPGRAGFSGQLDGWVSYFAAAVEGSGQSVEVRNFALAGSRIEHVIADQLQNALAAPADVMSCFVGINDLWIADLDLDEFGVRFNALFGDLRAHAPLVVTASIHDVFAPFPVRAPMREKLNRNVAAMNDIINDAVAEHDLVLLDLAGRPDMFTSAVRAVDRLHPNRYGHQLIAAEFIKELHACGHLSGVVPPTAAPVRRGTADLAHVAWVSGYVKQNWKRWREEIAASKARQSGSAQ